MSENQTKIQTAKGSHKNSVSHSGNVLINGRTTVHAGSCGTLTTVDVCRTQIGPAVVNIPYTNIAKSSDAANTAATVFINGHPVCTKNSCFAKSTGDEAGNRQGLHSGTIMGKAEFITASPNVYIEGIAAVRNGDLMVSNNRNTAPMPLVQPRASPAPAKALASVDALDKPGTPFKLALEIAGTQSLNMKGTLIARSGDSTHEVPLGSTARTDDHRRELIFENLAEGEYDLFLYQPDEKHGAYHIPLVQGFSTCSSEESSPRWQTVLVPLLPRCYTTTDADRTKAQYPRCSQDLGWLYVFVNGRLWREFKVEREGFFRDVNLTYEKGQDVRPATVQTSDSRVVVPYTIRGKAVALEMTYSEVQWSWARIDAMGGMAGDDSEEASQLRSRRMQKIDLSSYPDFDQDEGAIGPADQFELPRRYDLAAFRQSKVPVVYLHDPLGVAMNLADTHEAAWAEMESFIEALRVGLPLERVALHMRRGDTFGEAEQAMRRKVAAQFQVALLMQQIGFASEDKQRKYGRHLNRECLDMLLGTKERRPLRQTIMATRESLVFYLGSHAYQTALGDYLENTPERQLNGKGVVLYAARFLEQPATFLDAWLDPPDTHKTADRQTSKAAQAYMDRLKTAGNPAGLLLAGDLEIRTESTSRPAAKPRTVALLQDDAASQSLRLKTILEDQGVDLVTRAGAIGTALIEAFSSIKADLQTLEWVSERINTLKVPGFGEYTLVDVSLPEPKIPEGYHPVEGEATSLARRAVTYKAALALGARAATTDGMMSVVQKNRVGIFPATIEVTEVTTRQLVRKDLKPLPARLATRYHDSIPRAVAIAPFFVALDLLNLRTVLHQIAAGEVKGLGDGGLRGLQLISAVSGVAQGMAETGNLWLRVGKKPLSEGLTRTAARGRFLGNAAMGIFSVFDGIRDFRVADHDAGYAKMISAGAFFGLAGATTWAWAIPLTLVAVGGTLAGTWLEDDPVERFAKNGPLRLSPQQGATIWEKIRAHAQAPLVEARFSAEWPHWTDIERLFLDEYLLGFGVESAERGQQRRSFPPVYVDALSANCTLQRFVPMLSQAEIICHYYPSGCFSPTPTVIHPTVEDFRTDKDTQMISRIGVTFPIPQEHLRNQSPYWSAIIFCRIKPQVDREDCRPVLGEDGSPRYLAIRHHGNGMMRKTTRRIGTMQELTRPEFWRTT
ncbi:DUF4150 domain-containing protein [Desulfuromonas sp. KJ2020]|uniref:PAAR-like domain-containing protein n=1 Tax=Desulfuromonas sp. KJ2020 TaxID=2919173 RepID=UPI0020A74ACA|nr:PAAR-like domain-containing protein [Desulfuromonas sp. KJ2020]MCP3176343.1 DUF4150 domain-containing protein [Desulfuromonas sp. KJ2020]